MDIFNLKVRTRDRSCWKDLSFVSYMGIEGSIDESSLDFTNKNLVQTVVDIVDDEFRIKEEQLLATIQLEQDKMVAEKAIADAKAVTRRAILAMTALTNVYVLGVERYVLDVKNLIMDARDYALNIERKRVALGLLKAELAEERAAIKIAEIDLKIELEAINKKFVEVEVAKAELNVAKADVKLVLTEIAIEEAKLDEVEARIALVMTKVEKAKLIADIAMIYAEIVVRALTKRKYEVESAELAAEFARIASKLASILDILNIQQGQVSEQSQLQVVLLSDVAKLLSAKQDHMEVREEEAQSNLEVQEHEEAATAASLATEEGLKESLLGQKESYDDTRSSGVLQTNAAYLAAEAIVKYYASDTDSITDSKITATSDIARAISRA